MKEKVISSISELFENGQLSNDDMVQIIELCGGYLNLCTVPQYALLHNLSYNGTKKCRTIVPLFGVKFVLDNE